VEGKVCILFYAGELLWKFCEFTVYVHQMPFTTVKRPVCVTDHLLPSTAQFKNGDSYTST
jgi:hypothetical protein